MKKRMEGKVVIVTGAGSVGDGWGNGKAAAVLYAREGAHVLAVDLNENAARDTQQIISDEGGICHSVVGDVTEVKDIETIVSTCLDKFGRIDVLHNNVGIAQVGGCVETNIDSWNRIININQTSIFLISKCILPHMERQNGGSIVNIASIAGLRWLGFPYVGYSASKAAVMSITKDIAMQYASKGIRANCVLPGFMDTPMIREPLKSSYGGDVDTMRKKRDAQCPMQTMGDAWDVAYASLFLASDEAKYITGVDLIVDGGLTLKCV